VSLLKEKGRGRRGKGWEDNEKGRKRKEGDGREEIALEIKGEKKEGKWGEEGQGKDGKGKDRERRGEDGSPRL